MNKMLTAFIFSAQVFAGPCKYSPGITVCGPGTTDYLNMSGIVKMNGTTITKLANISGSFSADDSVLNELDIHGNSNINSSKINGVGNFYGMLIASKCDFKDVINIFSQNSKIDSSSTMSITITSGSPAKINILSSQIHGDITFYGASGQVLCDGNCQITGKINNGTLKTTGE